MVQMWVHEIFNGNYYEFISYDNLLRSHRFETEFKKLLDNIYTQVLNKRITSIESQSRAW
jgi:hypothetical protein